MEKELQGKLVEILTSIQDGVGQAKDFALGQLPDIAQSYIAYGRLSASLAVAIGLALVAVAPWALFRMAYHDRLYLTTSGEEEATHKGKGFLLFVVGVAGGAVGVALLLINVQSAMLVWMAPKVWLLKQLASLIR